ncbi:uncharacterized protein LOC123354709 [Mauremys mutica]|uniref:uncharacterized protein LOC123354709 n=1 Tax=Mauremys mutica TaxID=74926 RepID=UPI001D167F18|nr:uncharacterized protein LOC123354709 [Mauremys mutica]
MWETRSPFSASAHFSVHKRYVLCRKAWIQEDDSSCAGTGIVQEPYPEERLSEVNLISLNILLSRHEQSSAFCLLHKWLTKGKEVTYQSTVIMRRKARPTRPRSLSKSGISFTSGSGAVTAVSEINVWFGEGSAHDAPGSSLQRNHPGALAGREYAEMDLSSLDILLRRHEYSSSFCLLHSCLTKEKEVTVRVYCPHAMEKGSGASAGSGPAQSSCFALQWSRGALL